MSYRVWVGITLLTIFVSGAASAVAFIALPGPWKLLVLLGPAVGWPVGDALGTKIARARLAEQTLFAIPGATPLLWRMGRTTRRWSRLAAYHLGMSICEHVGHSFDYCPLEDVPA